MGGACSAQEEIRERYNILVGKSERKRSLEGPRPRWKII
jgi:hypothetical protein